jgi:hypothetical protein
VTADVSSGSLTVLTTATSEVNFGPYNGYYLYVKYTLSVTPPGVPSMVPTMVPTMLPTVVPTVFPTAVPTALPTVSYTVDEQWEGGTNSATSGVSHSFTGLDTSLYMYYLTVEVFETDFNDVTEYVDGIYAGSTTLSSNCNPGVESGTQYYTCVAGQGVTADVSSGSLTVLTTATSEVNYGPYNGYYLYVKYTLLKTHLPPPVVWEGGTNSPTTGVSHSFTGLDTSLYSYTLYRGSV